MSQKITVNSTWTHRAILWLARLIWSLGIWKGVAEQKRWGDLDSMHSTGYADTQIFYQSFLFKLQEVCMNKKRIEKVLKLFRCWKYNPEINTFSLFSQSRENQDAMWWPIYMANIIETGEGFYPWEKTIITLFSNPRLTVCAYTASKLFF